MLQRSIVLAPLLAVLLLLAGCSSHSPRWHQHYQERAQLAKQFTNWLERAERGDREAGYLVAHYYDLGIVWDGKVFMPRNRQQSRRWYQQAAESGEPHSLWLMRDRAKNAEQERYWIELGAKLNDPASLYSRGLAYAHVEDIDYKKREPIYPQDMQQAADWFSKAFYSSEAATVAANEAQRYDSIFQPGGAGRATEPDRIRARALEQLGRIYKEGAEGVARDRSKALRCFLEAYRLSGSIWLPRHIADIYRSGGDGVQIDFAEARKWGLRYYDAYIREHPTLGHREKKKVFLAELAIEEKFAADSDLPAEVREDKYKLALSEALRSGEHDKALVYFDYLDRIGVQLPDSMLFFRGEASLKAGDPQQAKQYLLDYIKAEGKQGPYYRKALERLSQIDEQLVPQ